MLNQSIIFAYARITLSLADSEPHAEEFTPFEVSTTPIDITQNPPESVRSNCRSEPKTSNIDPPRKLAYAMKPRMTKQCDAHFARYNQ